MASWCSGLYDTSRALLLSVARLVGDGSGASKPLTSLRKYTTSLAASDSAIISASHVERAMLFCLRDPHEMAADCHKTTHPEVDARVSHEASEKPASRWCSLEYVRPRWDVRLKYEMMWSVSAISSGVGL